MENSRPFLAVDPRRSLDRGDGLLGGSLFLGSLALYTATQTRGLSSISTDSNELVTKSALVEVAHMPGSPLYVWLGKLFSLLPVGQEATRVTWMSALLAAVAVGTLYVVTSRFVTGERAAAAGVALAFALSLTFWSQAVIAELYAPNMGVMALVIWCLLEWAACRSARPGAPGRADPRAGRRWLLAGAGLFGAAQGIHLSDLMFIPVFGLFLLLGWPLAPVAPDAPPRDTWRRQVLGGVRRLDWRGGLAALGVFALALLPYAWQATAVSRFPIGEGRPLAAPGWPLFYAFTLDAFSAWRLAIPPASWPDHTVLVLHLLERNIGWLLLPFMLAGYWQLLRRQTRLFYLFAGMALENLVFYGTYRAPDVDVFFIPAYWSLMPMVALGLVWAATAGARIVAGARGPRVVARLPARGRRGIVPLALAGLVLAACALEWRDNFTINDQAADVAFRDFYANVFATLPPDAWIFHHGASMGYDLLYYTQLYQVRPDLHPVVGMQEGEPANPPWPPGPAYAGVLKNDFFVPGFLWDPTGANNKWYTPELFGMFRWTGIVRTGWLTLYRLSPNNAPPADWLVPAGGPAAIPARRLAVPMAPGLTLTGVDLPPIAGPGRPLHIVRYWQATTPTLPYLATVLGDHRAVEAHVPLEDQLPAYLAARQIDPARLPT
ncbi:MAG TPA: DUF2723 domain-containing protein, partial [Chloroflexia bacterium]|nr:DUF2723 domain-containing protein [Chloroflexia bacterium]